jgi:hypothetical protein
LIEGADLNASKTCRRFQQPRFSAGSSVLG